MRCASKANYFLLLLVPLKVQKLPSVPIPLSGHSPQISVYKYTDLEGLMENLEVPSSWVQKAVLIPELAATYKCWATFFNLALCCVLLQPTSFLCHSVFIPSFI
ncbi:hypothetical protein GN956_G24625 [Arapaima gigas]